MALKRNDKGQNVEDFQNKLLRLGAQLLRWGADGDLGNETFEAFAWLCVHHGRRPDPDPSIISDGELGWVDSLIFLLDHPPAVKMPSRLIDRRQYAKHRWDYGPRPITQVRGGTMHQTACIMSVSKDPARFDDGGAHFFITRPAGGYYGDGDILWIYDVTRRVIHGNEWNTQCWGGEFDGLFAGLIGNMKTVWNDPKTPYVEQPVLLTDKQAESGLELIEWMFYDIQRQGGAMHSLNTHRQSSADRPSDPGEEVCKKVVEPMWRKLGLTDGGPGFVLGGPDGGRPNPREWFPNDPARAAYGYFDAPSYKPVR